MTCPAGIGPKLCPQPGGFSFPDAKAIKGRMLHEEIQFDTTQVTSLDWNSYPILRFSEAPEVTPIVVQRLEERSTGAGEEVMAAAAAAIANAFFDATGVRMEQYPFTPSRVLARLRRA